MEKQDRTTHAEEKKKSCLAERAQLARDAAKELNKDKPKKPYDPDERGPQIRDHGER